MRDDLNAGQNAALDEIMARCAPGNIHLLTGYAGSGKTYLSQIIIEILIKMGKRVAATATTHKAVAVLAKKFAAPGMPAVSCVTIHSLLSLTPKKNSEKMEFIRKRNAEPVSADVVIIDEVSQLSADMMKHVRRHLSGAFVLLIGDPAQIPPVGEVESLAFGIKGRSHLTEIVRQAEGNPVLSAAHVIRESQGGAIDWTWAKAATAKPFGVYTPGVWADHWMHKAFTSKEFANDPDTFRYICWTNDRVAQVNTKVRAWIYGDNIPTPFMPGERAIVRQPFIVDDTIVLTTNEEVTVISIHADQFTCRFEQCGDADAWSASMASWKVTLVKHDGQSITAHMVKSDREYNAILARIADEAADNRGRWGDHHNFKSSVARLQAIYAMTVHTSQGSTFRNVFMDVPDIRRRVASNLLEAQQLFYVAATRPTHALVLIGADL